jgi:RimJ/RimL family protein N-acetyltransferase
MTFQETVLATLRRLKEKPAEGILPVTQQGQLLARLIPVGFPDANSDAAVDLLAKWREQAADAFPSQFPVTFEGTKRWLSKNLLELPERFLFWVTTPEGQRVGHLGLYRFDFEQRQTELDNVIRGVSGILPGVMEASTRTLMDWSFQALNIDAVFLRVFSHNARAIGLYERCGFRETMRVPLARVVEDGVVHWVEVNGTYRQPVTRYFVTMCLPRAEWLGRRRAAA